MNEPFDPYYIWLGIPPADQPPHAYRLLGVEAFESNPDVIQNAADRQMAHLRAYQTGRNAPHSQRLLNEISAATGCLLDPEKKAEYDDQLKVRLKKATAEQSVVSPPSAGQTKDVPIGSPKLQDLRGAATVEPETPVEYNAASLGALQATPPRLPMSQAPLVPNYDSIGASTTTQVGSYSLADAEMHAQPIRKTSVHQSMSNAHWAFAIAAVAGMLFAMVLAIALVRTWRSAPASRGAAPRVAREEASPRRSPPTQPMIQPRKRELPASPAAPSPTVRVRPAQPLQTPVTKDNSAHITDDRISVNGLDKVIDIEAGGRDVTVSGLRHQLKVTGPCRSLSISGNDHKITLEAVGKITISGGGHRVRYRRGLDGKDPEIHGSGEDQVLRIDDGEDVEAPSP